MEARLPAQPTAALAVALIMTHEMVPFPRGDGLSRNDVIPG
jgi:hypothetical protein